MTNIKHVNSIVDRDFRNTINQLIDLANAQGIAIQDLVAEGQLTPEQYSMLIQSVNGLIKKGELSVNDINKNLGKIDESFLSASLRSQIAGNAPLLSDVADGIITTTKMADYAVTGKKIDNKTITADKMAVNNSIDTREAQELVYDTSRRTMEVVRDENDQVIEINEVWQDGDTKHIIRSTTVTRNRNGVSLIQEVVSGKQITTAIRRDSEGRFLNTDRGVKNV